MSAFAKVNRLTIKTFTFLGQSVFQLLSRRQRLLEITLWLALADLPKDPEAQR
jgi:hypothetical protein